MFTEVSCAKSNKKLSLYNDVQKSKKVPLSCAVVIRERERKKTATVVVTGKWTLCLLKNGSNCCCCCPRHSSDWLNFGKNKKPLSTHIHNLDEHFCRPRQGREYFYCGGGVVKGAQIRRRTTTGSSGRSEQLIRHATAITEETISRKLGVERKSSLPCLAGWYDRRWFGQQ